MNAIKNEDITHTMNCIKDITVAEVSLRDESSPHN